MASLFQVAADVRRLTFHSERRSERTWRQAKRRNTPHSKGFAQFEALLKVAKRLECGVFRRFRCQDRQTHAVCHRFLTPLSRLSLRFCSTLLCVLVLISPRASLAAASETKPKPAKLKISGYGILGDRELKRILRTLELR